MPRSALHDVLEARNPLVEQLKMEDEEFLEEAG